MCSDPFSVFLGGWEVSLGWMDCGFFSGGYEVSFFRVFVGIGVGGGYEVGDLGASLVLYLIRVQGVRFCGGCRVLNRCLENKHLYWHMSEVISSEEAKFDGVVVCCGC